MKPKDKALELLSRFGDIEHLGVYGNYDGTWQWSSTRWNQQIKEAALIAIDEILSDDVFDMSVDLFNKRIEYWNEVKNEIININF